MNTWVTSDHHFGHANIIKYCHRPFRDVFEMDDTLVENWNFLVKPGDVVFHLGDFTLKSVSAAIQYLSRLNGIIYLMSGSHDEYKIGKWYDTNTDMCHIIPPIYEPPLPLTHGEMFVLCHYAMRVWNRSHYGAYHLYGHSHGKLPGQGRSMDVGVDTNGFYPYNIDDIIFNLKGAKNFDTVEDKDGLAE